MAEGEQVSAEKARPHRPDWIAVGGVTAYRIGFDRLPATFGPQPERLGGLRLWVLPNPSGLNAHYPPETLAAAFAELRVAAAGPAPLLISCSRR